MLSGGALPTWIGWLGVVLGLSRWVKALAPFVVLPDAVTAVSGLLFLAWFLAIVVALTRSASSLSTGTWSTSWRRCSSWV